VAAAGRSGTFQVFDMKNGEESLRLAFDSSPLAAIAFQPGLDAAKTEILAVGGKDGVRVYELQRDALRTLARDQTKALNATLTKEQCTQYLRGKDCSILP
jgi:hypothetical protein